MFTISDSESRSRRLGRRGFLQVGALGVGGITLANLLQLKAQGADRPRSQKSVIMVYLHGGPPHMDMFDMKPDAPVELRGEFSPIRTNVVGLEICELMPKLATIADKMSVIRNISFKEYVVGHNPPLVYTGYYTKTETPSHRPTFGSVFSHFRGKSIRGVPPYVAFDGINTRETHYLGVSHNPFVPGDKNSGLLPLKEITQQRSDDRRNLLSSLDNMRRDIDDARGNMQAHDAFTSLALDMITSSKAYDAFDISKEPESVRAMYGEAGEQFLQARRLVEAGVPVVRLTANRESKTWGLAGPWDTHGNNFKTLRKLLPELDQNLFALITDLSQRGLDQDVAVVVWGEMGRTPKINNNNAGRDHWNEVGFALVSGGGLKMGQVIGKTTKGAERSVGTPYVPSNMLATLYDNVLGIDPAATYPDLSGRPLYVLDNRKKIRELV
jgi:hypothetical protein